MHKLNKVGVPVAYNLREYSPFELFCCEAETPHMDLRARINFKLNRLNKANTLADLLEENDVQVHCKLGATQINPLIEVETIDSISFTGK